MVDEGGTKAVAYPDREGSLESQSETNHKWDITEASSTVSPLFVAEEVLVSSPFLVVGEVSGGQLIPF